VAGELDPDVRAPDGILPRSAEEIADEPSAAEGGRTGGAVRAPERFDLGKRGRGILEPFGEQRLGAAVPALTLREELSGLLEVLVGEGTKL
jgi:hypothetical protein